jgi:Zn-dependent protease
VYRDDGSPSGVQRLANASWPLLRAFGVDLRVHWTIALVPVALFALIVRAVDRTSPDWPTALEQHWESALPWALVLTIALYLSVLIHQMGHVAAARRIGEGPRVVTLTPLGGLAHADPPAASPGAEIYTAVAGPMTQAVFAAMLAVPYLVFANAEASRDALWPAMFLAFLGWQAALFFLNILPCYPLDGGRVVRGVLMKRMSAGRAAIHVAYLGWAGALLLAIAGASLLLWSSHAAATELEKHAHSASAPLLAAAGLLLLVVAVNNFIACRRLLVESRLAAALVEPVEAWRAGRGDDALRDSIAESERLSRAEERRERRAADARRHEETQHRRLKERIDQLLDRINEVGGVDKLTPLERRELADASEMLRRETAGQH